jgi:galactokinase
MTNTPLRVSTPGRICLFGEHQDYLQLPVIPCAISLRISIEGHPRSDQGVVLDLPDVGGREEFSLAGPLAYGRERDYFRSTVNVLRRSGYTFSHGVECVVRGNIPINSGTSSSSALIVSWVKFLGLMSDQGTDIQPPDLARLAHAAEVLEFNEPGGMMDHFSTAYGGVTAIDFHPKPAVQRLPSIPGAFVLGDSGEPKDTVGILARVKNGVLRIVRQLSARAGAFSLQSVSRVEAEELVKDLPRDEQLLLLGTIDNRDMTWRARALLGGLSPDHRLIGSLLNEHQAVLRDVLKISTRKIDRMLASAIGAGAYGGKINGSGGGGCMFVYAPEDPERVARAIEQEGGQSYVVRVDEGTRREESPVNP